MSNRLKFNFITIFIFCLCFSLIAWTAGNAGTELQTTFEQSGTEGGMWVEDVNNSGDKDKAWTDDIKNFGDKDKAWTDDIKNFGDKDKAWTDDVKFADDQPPGKGFDKAFEEPPMVGVNKCRKCGQNFPVTPDGIEQYNAHIKTCGQADADKKLPVIDYDVEGVEEIVNDEKKLVLNTMGLYGDVKMPDYDTKGLTKNQLIVRNIYKAVLSRLPLNSELRDSEWVKALDDGSMNENQVKNKIMTCNEKKIIDIYQKYLLRGPGLEERQQWMKKIEAVKPENCPELILWIERCIKNSNEALKKMQ